MSEPWPFVFVDEVRYGDLDANRHLNNVAVHQFFESARIAYLESLLPHLDSVDGGTGFPIIFAETHVRFRSPGFYREELHVHVRPEALRRSSVRIAFRIVCAADDRLVADGWGTVVGYDYAAARAAPLTAEITEALRTDGAEREPTDD
jgi:acyl-CoA thioester hydrolase